MLKLQKIPHTVLNAKFHMQEAEIVARAGFKGSVTISTNMAGRGTDIKLGEGVSDLGGLYVLATERHEVPAHRPPAARPLCPAGRSRSVTLLRKF